MTLESLYKTNWKTLPEIERAFVHLDYDDKHAFEHLVHEDC